jgi:hypothetical protein
VIERLTDPVKCREVTDKHPDYFTFDVEKWFLEDKNYALQEGDNIAFGEYKSPGVYWVHFCFDTAKGREAIQLTRDMFTEFCKQRPVRIAIGLIQVNNKKAKWLIRQVGFTSLGLIDTENGLCEMFYSKGIH